MQIIIDLKKMSFSDFCKFCKDHKEDMLDLLNQAGNMLKGEKDTKAVITIFDGKISIFVVKK